MSDDSLTAREVEALQRIAGGNRNGISNFKLYPRKCGLSISNRGKQWSCNPSPDAILPDTPLKW